MGQAGPRQQSPPGHIRVLAGSVRRRSRRERSNRDSGDAVFESGYTASVGHRESFPRDDGPAALDYYALSELQRTRRVPELPSPQR